MKLDYAFFADNACLLDNGKLFVHAGNLEIILAERFPCTHPQIALVVRLALAPNECGRPYRLDAFLSSPSGAILGPRMHAEFTAPLHPTHPKRGGTVATVFGFSQTTFQGPGDYLAHIAVDGTELGRLPLELVQKPQ